MDLLAELRRRLDLPSDLVDDETLTHFLDVATAAIGPWIDEATTDQANVDEATVQLAVKMWNTSTQGVTSISGEGDWIAPAPSASPGLVRSVFGVLGPAMRTGGVSV